MKRILLALGLLFSVTAKADNTSDLMGLGMPGALAGKIGGWLGDNDLAFTASSYEIIANTSNGSDTKNICISGGGDCGDQGRGGYFQAFGTDAVGADAGDIYLVCGTGGQVNLFGDMIFGEAQFSFTANTSDGADTKEILINGGGGNGPSRGAYIQLFGNEGTSSGAVYIQSGDIAGADVIIPVTDDLVVESPGGTDALVIDTATSAITFAGTSSAGWSWQFAANQACNTTCTSACIGGIDTGVAFGNSAFVGCSTSSADTCLCAGVS